MHEMFCLNYQETNFPSKAIKVSMAERFIKNYNKHKPMTSAKRLIGPG